MSNSDSEDPIVIMEREKKARAAARVMEGPGPYEIPLDYPFTAKVKMEGGAEREERITVLTVRRPVMKEVTSSGDRATKFGGVSAVYWLAAQLTGQPQNVIEAMDPDDFAEVEAIIEVFTQKLQGTAGKTSSAK